MINKKTIFHFLISIIILTLLFLIINPRTKKNPEFTKITIGLQTSPAMALPMVAKEQGFFMENGLDVEIVEFTAGKFALEAFLGGSLDFAISGDVPVNLAHLQGHNFIIPAQVVKNTINEVRIVGKKNGKENASEYFSGQKIRLATSIGGGPEFFTYEFLNSLNIDQSQIQIISQQPKDMVPALLNGDVDAISIFDPFAFFAEKKLGDNSITFTNPDIYSETYVLTTNLNERITDEVITKILMSMISAEEFTKNNPDIAKEIVSKYTLLEKETLDAIWDNFDFEIALTKKLLNFWEKQFEWIKKTKKIEPLNEMPIYKNILYTEPLVLINKEKVTIEE